MKNAKEHYVVGGKYLIEKAMKGCGLLKALRWKKMLNKQKSLGGKC